MSDFFDQLQQTVQQDQKYQRQQAFEERIVKRILKDSGIVIPVAATHREAGEKYGNTTLNFEWFRNEYPAFPLRLFAEKLPYTHETTLGDLYGKGNFKKLQWWREFIGYVDEYGIDLCTQHAAFLFSLPHAKDAFLMVLHNQPNQETVFFDVSQREEPWPRTTFPIGQTGVVAVLESFQSFMQTVGRHWVPV